jgi:hypothetical protein
LCSFPASSASANSTLSPRLRSRLSLSLSDQCALPRHQPAQPCGSIPSRRRRRLFASGTGSDLPHGQLVNEHGAPLALRVQIHGDCDEMTPPTIRSQSLPIILMFKRRKLRRIMKWAPWYAKPAFDLKFSKPVANHL